VSVGAMAHSYPQLPNASLGGSLGHPGVSGVGLPNNKRGC
jgi:hypothetical protein